jgi:Mn-dependent DtxR family transcriptional regulator
MIYAIWKEDSVRQFLVDELEYPEEEAEDIAELYE